MPNIKKILKEYTKKYLTEKQPGIAKNALSYATTGEFADPSPADTTVPGGGDSSGASAGRAEFLVKSIQNRLRDMGLHVDDLDAQKTIAQLKVAPFGFSYSLMWPEKNVWGERGAVNLKSKDGVKEMVNIDTRAKITNDNKDGGVILETKEGLEYFFYDTEELSRTLGGPQGKLPPGIDGENITRMLEEGVTYKVKCPKCSPLTPNDEEGEEGEEGEEEGEEEGPEIPNEIRENRNEIFRLLLKNYGGYNGAVVYGDGFDSSEKARQYGRLIRAVKAGKEDKSKLKEFRQKAGRDNYSMMVAALRKGYPTKFLERLSSAFGEFDIKWNKETVEEGINSKMIFEAENDDKYKRWGKVFDISVIGNKTIDKLDQNVRGFMMAIKKWFAIPVKGVGKDSTVRKYNIDYNKDMVNKYWGSFYGKKQESKISLMNILNEVVNVFEADEEDNKDKANIVGKYEKGGQTMLKHGPQNTEPEEKEVGGVINPDDPNYPEYFLLKIRNGGLETVGEDEGESLERKERGGRKKGGFFDAIVLKGLESIISPYVVDDKLIPGELSQDSVEAKPGFANGAVGSGKAGKVKVVIGWGASGIIKTGGKVELYAEGDNKVPVEEINKLLQEIINQGKMKIGLSKKSNDIIILSYPEIPAKSQINKHWGDLGYI